MSTFSSSRRAKILACAFQLIGLAIAHAQQPSPTIDIIFEIAAEPFKSTLSSQQRDKVEADIGRELVRLCSDPIAYLNWQQARAIGPRAALKVVLRNEHAGYSDEIYLQYISILGTQQMEWPRDPKKTVYQPFALSVPAHKPDQLEADLLRNIRADFANDDFRRLLDDRLATTIPITEEIQFDEATQRCVLPLSWESLHATEDSVLRAEFQARPPQESQARAVQIRMAPERWESELKCRVFQFQYPPTTFLQAQQLSDPKIPESLREMVGKAAVYMEKYVRDFRANTSGSLNVTP
jgi:hypothetical protein